MLLVEVVPEETVSSVMGVPSTLIFSLAASVRPLTLKVRLVMFCPLSTVLMLAALKTLTGSVCVEEFASPPSTNKGLDAVAVSVGASLTAVTLVVSVTGSALM